MVYSTATERLLSKTMKELMATTPFERISVKQICEESGVHRKTFYYHFDNKYQLVNWTFFYECISPIRQTNHPNLFSIIYHIAHYLDENREFITCALKMDATEPANGNASPFPTFFSEQIKMFLRDRLPESYPGASQTGQLEHESYYVNTAASFFAENMRTWLLQHPELAADQYLELLGTVVPQMK